MENTKVTIRFASPSDAPALLEIYRPYVLETAITFEYDVPSVEEFTERIRNTQKRYPYLVAQCGDEIVGYAYVSSFVGRAAYDWSVETSIYVEQNRRKLGIGKKLYDALECILKEMHICNLNACIGYPEIEDEYLTKNSVSFHSHLGYTMVGEFHKSGYKFNRWYNMVWMEKMIGEHLDQQPSVVNVNELKDLIKTKYEIC